MRPRASYDKRYAGPSNRDLHHREPAACAILHQDKVTLVMLTRIVVERCAKLAWRMRHSDNASGCRSAGSHGH